MKIALLHSEELNSRGEFFSNFYNAIEVGLQSADLTRMSIEQWGRNSTSVQFEIACIIGSHKRGTNRGALSSKVIEHQSKNNRKCLIMERGFIGDREKYWSMGFGGLNGRGDFNNNKMPSDRFDKLNIKLSKYLNTEKDVLFSLQLPWDSSVNHVWYPEVVYNSVKTILDTTNRSIILRHHPRYKEELWAGQNQWEYRPRLALSLNKTIKELCKNPRVKISKTQHLKEDLRKCHCLVTFNSNSAVEAIIEGVPSIVLDEGSMIYDVSHNSLFEIDTLHPATTFGFRKQKLYDIAYSQWNNNEIKKGLPFRHLGLI